MKCCKVLSKKKCSEQARKNSIRNIAVEERKRWKATLPKAKAEE